MMTVYVYSINLPQIKLYHYLIIYQYCPSSTAMRYRIQIIAGNILQQVPLILLTYQNGQTRKKYLFNFPEKHYSYSKRHDVKFGSGMKIFFTKYTTDTMSGLMSLFLSMNSSKNMEVDLGMYGGVKSFNTGVYFNKGAYTFWKHMKEKLGLRLLPYSFYEYEGQEVVMGLRAYEQNQKLVQYDRKKWIRGKFDNQQLVKLLGNPSNAAQNIVKTEDRSLLFDDSRVKIMHFSTSDSSPYSNYVIIPLVSHTPANKQKLAQLRTRFRTESEYQKMKSALFTSGSFKFANGEIINLSQIQESIGIVGCAMILHYKTEQDLKQILQNKKLSEYRAQIKEKGQSLRYVIHIMQGNGEIIFREAFSQLRLVLGANVEHIIYNRYCRAYENMDQFRKQMFSMNPQFRALYEIHKYGYWSNIVDRVTDLYTRNVAKLDNLRERVAEKQKTNKSDYGPLILYRPKYEITLAPVRRTGYDLSNVSNFDQKKQPQGPSHIIQPNQQFFSIFQEDLQYKLRQHTKQSDPTIIFLGTSSMKTLTLRNVSGILIKLEDKQTKQQFSVALDCGDGISDQFINHFGLRYEEQLLKVRILFLSHMHQDHCGGVFHFIAKRNQIIRERTPGKQQDQHKMFVIMPANMVSWFESYSNNVENLKQFCEVVVTQNIAVSKLNSLAQIGKNVNNSKKESVFQNNKKNNTTKKVDFRVLFNQCMSTQEIIPQLQGTEAQNSQQLKKFQQTNKKQLDTFKKFLSDKKISKFLPVPVVHCNQSYGLILEHKSAKISFSGDCRPTTQFLQMAAKSTIMIHQATFKHNQKSKAKRNAHSTTSQAIEIGFKNQSLMTVLTHFSPGQASTPPETTEQIKKSLPIVDVNYIKNCTFKASDHMEFRLSEMYKLPAIVSRVWSKIN